MFEKLRQIWKSKDLRKSIFFVLMMLVVFRIAAHIPIPGIDVAGLKDFFAQNQILGLLNLFSGGGLENFSIVMLGIGPYITASIILQLLTMIIPALETLSKEPDGQQKINRYTRFLTLPLAALQGYSFITLMQRQGGGQLIGDLTSFQWISAIITVTAGTVFLMWLGELMSEKKIGNGISLLIFAGIIASLPSAVQRLIATFDATQAFNLLIFLGIAIVTIVVVVIITEGQRNIPVNYARRVRGNRMYGGVNTHLPLRVNMAGVIPIIFAISIILIPPMIAQFFVSATTPWVAGGARFVVNLFQNQVFYGLFYFIMVFAFTYFYTFVVFHPHQIAENLQKQGGFIPGIRPGRHTADYLQKTANKILLAGALFLGLIAVLPIIIQPITGISSLAIGGTSLLIVVAVVIELVKQIDSQLTMRDYDGL
ncbi:preprotein translocase subunit SecY [bacterium]|jgi:preprotein translocase subunit SecY|nr:preprotein translocase subunit SecY [bacterium]MBT4121621.1 preprotein translocase subunit SecY [bacterium]MBT4335114.1 preprotein translocase subunit SecY [bacterium]MBT4495277.1 preprotein translocase subunit SecY [bacterium]MBT4763901.1 preprotein translocase subunit SecY [bacterium]